VASEDYDRSVAAWLVWALVAVLLAIGEVLTPGLFFLGPIALAAAAAAAAAALGGGWVVELVVFVVGSGASVGGLRPIARRHIRMPFSMRTGAAALVGASAVVLERVDVNGGRVKIGGEVWSARTFGESQVLEPGTRVQVAEIQGATALVYV
jgi:membrane protein implicated in regulation of membrane protease activity